MQVEPREGSRKAIIRYATAALADRRAGFYPTGDWFVLSHLLSRFPTALPCFHTRCVLGSDRCVSFRDTVEEFLMKRRCPSLELFRRVGTAEDGRRDGNHAGSGRENRRLGFERHASYGDQNCG